jgi:hypothetical protein
MNSHTVLSRIAEPHLNGSLPYSFRFVDPDPEYVGIRIKVLEILYL